MTTPSSKPAALLTAKDLSEQTGISVSSIYRKRSLGESLPRAIKLSDGAVRWRQGDVDAWLEAHLEPVTP